MPLKDHLKTLKSEFNNVKSEFKKFQGQGQGQQSSYYQGQGQQQGYGGYPQQGQGQYGGQQYGGQQQSQTPPGQHYQAPAWQAPNQQAHQGWSQQQHQQQYPGGAVQQQQYQHQQQGPPINQYQQPPQHNQTYTPPRGQHSSPPPIPYNSHPSSTPPPPQQPTHSNPTTYYSPTFHPSIPVSSIFEHKLGNNNGWGNAELQSYTSSPANSFHTQASTLTIRAISQPSHPDPSQRYTSARLISRQLLAYPSGCLTTILTSPSAPGIWPALWLLPHEPFTWPVDGEIDIAESWNGDVVNHSCLHWGHFTGQDSQKHRVVETPIQNLRGGQVKYEFCWQQDENGRGRMLWLIDGGGVMRAEIPEGTRRLKEWNVVINVAMGGNVCGGKTPKEGSYDFVVHDLRMSGEPDGGWGRVEQDWKRTREGHTM